MKTSDNTILITGGTAGIGYELAKLFIKENKVIVTGRDQERLDKAVASIPGLIGIKSDVAVETDVIALTDRISKDYPELNILINNAGAATYNNVMTDTDVFEKAQMEMHVNYLSVIRLNQRLLPVLQRQNEAAIVNVSSIAAFAPRVQAATYAATKAALHSYSRTTRHFLKDTGVRVFELMPPLVATDFSAAIGGHKNGMPAAEVAQALMTAFETETYEVHVGRTAQVYKLYLESPEKAIQAANQG